MNYYAVEMTRGKQREIDCIGVLRYNGYHAFASDNYEDIHADVDAYYRTETGVFKSASIKAPHAFNLACEFGFETTRERRDGSVEPSWLWTSEAVDFLFIYPDNSVWRVDVAALRELLRECESVGETPRTTKLKACNREALIQSFGTRGKPYAYIDASTYWISKIALRDLGIAEKIVQSGTPTLCVRKQLPKPTRKTVCQERN